MKNITVVKYSLMLVFTLFLAPLSAEEKKVDFTTIWELVKTSSPSIKSAVSEKKAAEISSSRSSRHWFPVIYADARGYVTNDPALTFMSNLGQREVNQNDFIPGNLNEPGRNIFQKGTLGIDLPLYEGGAKYEAARAMKKLAEAKAFRNQSVILGEYSSAASVYGHLMVLEKEMAELSGLSETISAMLARYQKSLSSNPVEYNGILSLRTLKNRIDVQLAESKTMSKHLRDYLEKMSGNRLPEEWDVNMSETFEFADSSLHTEKTSAGGSFHVMSWKAMAESSKNRAEAEKAVYLPRIGLFAETSIYNGERNSADSYTAGFYIRMNILSPTDYGAAEQAKLDSNAIVQKAREAELKASVELEKLNSYAEALKKNIAVMRESSTLMKDLVRNSRRLYASGSIKSFQLADVYSKQADLITNLAAAEREYLSVRAGIYNYSMTEIKGGEYEK